MPTLPQGRKGSFLPAAHIDPAWFRFFVEHSPDGQFVLLDGRFLYLNDAGLRMFGVPAEDAAALTLLDVLHPSEHERSTRNIALRISGVLRGATTYLSRRRDGTTFPIEIHSAPWDQNGRKGVFGVIRDITSRRKMEERLERMERSALVSRLASGIAHDFNNLLAVIQTNAELAVREAREPQVKAALARIRTAADRGAEKVRHVRQMGANGGSVGSEDLRPLYLNPLVEDVLELTRARWQDEAESLGHSYDVRWSPGLPPPVDGAPSDLRAALVALVFNAIEALPRGGRIALRTAEDVDGNAIISVQDNGEGIAQHQLSRLCDAFYTTRPDRQMGLGLHLVQTVLVRHGGRLEIDSEPGQGSTFALIFPRAAHGPAEPPPPPRIDLARKSGEMAALEPARPKTRGGRSILLIDDQADLVQVLRTMLEAKGFAVDTAFNGKDGVALVESTKYNLVLTDLGMPDISGWEVARKVRELQPKTPIVLMTGWAADIDPDRLSEHQVDALLPKPFRTDQLLETIEKALLRG